MALSADARLRLEYGLTSSAAGSEVESSITSAAAAGVSGDSAAISALGSQNTSQSVIISTNASTAGSQNTSQSVLISSALSAAIS